MKEIRLAQDKVTLVDDGDFEWLSQWRWCVETVCPGVYYVLKRNPYARMHRLIVGVTNPKVLVDHVDHDGLNNQRSNLRIATNSQNQANTRARIGGTSRFKGVSWASPSRNSRPWRAAITIHGKYIHLGLYDTEENAAAAYATAATRYFGTFANRA